MAAWRVAAWRHENINDSGANGEWRENKASKSMAKRLGSVPARIGCGNVRKLALGGGVIIIGIAYRRQLKEAANVGGIGIIGGMASAGANWQLWRQRKRTIDSSENSGTIGARSAALAANGRNGSLQRRIPFSASLISCHASNQRLPHLLG